jgi:hypothetical protein
MSMKSHVYSNKYYDYIDKGSLSSADIIVPMVKSIFEVKSVMDVGSGRGAWLQIWQEHGVSDLVGVDGSYVELESFRVSPSVFFPHDITKPLNLKRKFDVVQSLEVAEHIDEKYADILIDTITRHGDFVLFSAAVPGQGGEHHVNEQPISYWVNKFKMRGYIASDTFRPALMGIKSVEPWYKNNLLFFVNEKKLNEIELVSFPSREYQAPLSWKMRTSILKLFPRNVIEILAKLNHFVSRSLS